MLCGVSKVHLVVEHTERETRSWRQQVPKYEYCLLLEGGGGRVLRNARVCPQNHNASRPTRLFY
jgi:hypothetical protein